MAIHDKRNFITGLATAGFLSLTALTGASALDVSAEDGFKPIKVAPGYAKGETIIDVLMPFLRDHPESLGGRQSLTLSIENTGSSYTVDIVKEGYLDDSLAGEHFRGSVIPATGGWELLDLYVKPLCYRGLGTSGKCL